jgi:hypothetical protein
MTYKKPFRYYLAFFDFRYHCILPLNRDCAIIFADKICRRDLPPRRSPGFVLECGEGLRLEFGLPFFGFFWWEIVVRLQHWNKFINPNVSVLG